MQIIPPVSPRASSTWPRLCLLLLLAAGTAAAAVAQSDERHPPLQLFINAASPDEEKAARALAALDEWWRDDYACLLLDLARFMRPTPRPQMTGILGGPADAGFPAGAGTRGTGRRRPRREVVRPDGGSADLGPGGDPPPVGSPRPDDDPSARVRRRLVSFLEEHTGQAFGDDLRAWRRWHWNRPCATHPRYATFKKALYGRVSWSMGRFFDVGGETTIRLDEIDWSGQLPNQVPVLDHPKHVPAAEARDLKDKHVVFGLAVGGEARAYPERILVWHELTRDRLGETELTIVSDPLCGTVTSWASGWGGEDLTFGVTELVYRSNRLMYDKEGVSLWSTLDGHPVSGSLAAQGVQLQAYPVVRTRWREWKALHPGTTVLSTETGYPFDYSRERPFRRYEESDRLMFEVPRYDDRLDRKEPVLAVLLPQAGGEGDGTRRALALRVKLLEKKQNRLYQRPFAGHELVIVTSPDGAQRVYDAGDTRFVGLERDGRVQDESGGFWRLDEAALVPEVTDASPKVRLPAQRVFWFAWQAQFPGTELVK